MKIAITVSSVSPGGGLTKYVCTLADILTQEGGNDVWVITTHTSSDNAELARLVVERGIKYESLGDKSTIAKYVSLTKLLRHISPNVIINNYNATTQYILPLLPRKIKVVHILHNNTPDFYRVGAINGSRVAAWIAPTPAVKDYFNEYTHGRYSARVVSIPHAVDDTTLEHDYGKRGVPQLTYVGVLYEHKGVRILPQIIKQLRAVGHEFHFTFVGDGVLHDELQEQLSDEVAAGVVEFTGRVAGEEVFRRLNETDIFVYPTHIDSFGLVIAEAMMNGAVPVVTLLKGITDTIVDDGVNGYLLRQDDVAGFVGKISCLLGDEAMRERMGKAAGQKARECFSKQVMKHNYIQFINSLFK